MAGDSKKRGYGRILGHLYFLEHRGPFFEFKKEDPKALMPMGSMPPCRWSACFCADLASGPGPGVQSPRALRPVRAMRFNGLTPEYTCVTSTPAKPYSVLSLMESPQALPAYPSTPPRQPRISFLPLQSNLTTPKLLVTRIRHQAAFRVFHSACL